MNKGKRWVAAVFYLVLASVLVGIGVWQVGKGPERLSEERIAELREEYPVYEGYYVDPLAPCSRYSHQREAVERMGPAVYAEVVEGGTPPRPVIRVLRDTKGEFRAGEEYSLSVGRFCASYVARFPVGTRIAAPMWRSERVESELYYDHLSAYYVVEDKYLLSVYPDVLFGEEENFTGKTLREYWRRCRTWKRFAPEGEEQG